MLEVGPPPAWYVSQGMQRIPQSHQQDVEPLVSFRLAHTEGGAVGHLYRCLLEIHQKEQQPVLRRRQWTVLVRGVAPGSTRVPIKAPGGHMGLECGIKGRDQLLQLCQRETGQIQDLRGAGLEIGEP